MGVKRDAGEALGPEGAFGGEEVKAGGGAKPGKPPSTVAFSTGKPVPVPGDWCVRRCSARVISRFEASALTAPPHSLTPHPALASQGLSAGRQGGH